ncbi:MAG: hypothetical protein IJJ68_04440 [Prevotella sp.]|jgi:hypothetical protein|nr:hypothetical protein [Prevotella sp.]MBR4369082.1 hypothetical protein [Prevotella sp.]
MKKLMIAAMMLVSASTAFAQDLVKQISKADYAAAAEMLKNNLGSLSAEQKAKCYNALVDKNASAFNKAYETFVLNQQLGKKDKIEYVSTMQGIKDAMECDIYDNQPNDKGKVAPKFNKKNAGRLAPNRVLLIFGGQEAQEAGNNDLAYEYYKVYTESGAAPMFEESVKDGKDQNLGQVARVAAVMAYQRKDYASAEKYVDIALKDPEMVKEATNLKLAILGAQLDTKEDSLKYVQKLEGIYAADNNNDAVLSTLCTFYESVGQKDKVLPLVEKKLAADPNNFTALALKGDIQMRNEQLDEAAETLKKALAVCPAESKVALNAAVGDCYFFKAQERVNNYKGQLAPTTKQVFADVFKQAIEYYEYARDLDVDKVEKSRYAYRLYGATDFVYGSDDPKTKAAAKLAGVE